MKYKDWLKHVYWKRAPFYTAVDVTPNIMNDLAVFLKQRELRLAEFVGSRLYCAILLGEDLDLGDFERRERK